MTDKPQAYSEEELALKRNYPISESERRWLATVDALKATIAERDKEIERLTSKLREVCDFEAKRRTELEAALAAAKLEADERVAPEVIDAIETCAIEASERSPEGVSSHSMLGDMWDERIAKWQQRLAAAQKASRRREERRVNNLAEVLKSWRWSNRLNVRDAAKMLGLVASTFNRIERGEAMDGKTLATVITWLLKPASDIRRSK